MGIIKSAQAPSTLQPFSMADVEAAARRILRRAQRQAEELLLAAQAEAEALKEQALAEGAREGHAQGHAAGLAQGLEEGRAQALEEHRQQLGQLVATLSTGAAGLDASRRDLEADALREVIHLAAAIARRVTKRQGLVDEAVLAANVSEAMRLVVHASDVRIGIHPFQRETLERVLPLLRAEWPALKHVELVDDPTLAPGGCRIHTRGGLIDADLDGQLDRVINDLLPAPATPPAAAGEEGAAP